MKMIQNETAERCRSAVWGNYAAIVVLVRMKWLVNIELAELT